MMLSLPVSIIMQIQYILKEWRSDTIYYKSVEITTVCDNTPGNTVLWVELPRMVTPKCIIKIWRWISLPPPGSMVGRFWGILCLNSFWMTSSLCRKNQFVSIKFSSRDTWTQIWSNCSQHLLFKFLSILHQFSPWCSIQLTPLFIGFRSF